MNDMIARARELAKLAEKATPRPWVMFTFREMPPLGSGQYIASTRAHEIRRHHEVGGDDKKNAELIAAAPEMAKLLGEMANELEKARKLCREFSMAYYDAKEELDRLKRSEQKK